MGVFKTIWRFGPCSSSGNFYGSKIQHGIVLELNFGPGIFLGFDFSPIRSSLSLEIWSTPPPWSYYKAFSQKFWPVHEFFAWCLHQSMPMKVDKLILSLNFYWNQEKLKQEMQTVKVSQIKEFWCCLLLYCIAVLLPECIGRCKEWNHYSKWMLLFFSGQPSCSCISPERSSTSWNGFGFKQQRKGFSP